MMKYASCGFDGIENMLIDGGYYINVEKARALNMAANQIEPPVEVSMPPEEISLPQVAVLTFDDDELEEPMSGSPAPITLKSKPT